eukprot:1152423-Pelagomonas_calceolata.AAC.3
MVVCSRRKLTYPALAIAAHLPPPVLLMSSVLQQVMPYNALAIAAHLPPVLLICVAASDGHDPGADRCPPRGHSPASLASEAAAHGPGQVDHRQRVVGSQFWHRHYESMPPNAALCSAYAA